MNTSSRVTFTLVEVMIAVSIVMVLAAIAVPAYYDYQMRARFAEVPLMAEGIAKAGTAYSAFVDDPLALDHCQGPVPWSSMAWPYGSLDKETRPWVTTECDAWGFEPDGPVRAFYNFWFAPKMYGFSYSDMDDDDALVYMTYRDEADCDPTSGCRCMLGDQLWLCGDDY